MWLLSSVIIKSSHWKPPLTRTKPTWIWILFEVETTKYDPFFNHELGQVWPHYFDSVQKQLSWLIFFLKSTHFLIFKIPLLKNFFFQWNEDGSSNTHLLLVKTPWISGYYFLRRNKEIQKCIQTTSDPSCSNAILYLLSC